MKYDLHTHSKYSSDGWMDIKTMINTGIKRGLSGIAITDHNTIKGGLESQKFKYKDFEIVIGSEISTERGELIGLFLSEEIQSRVFLEVIDEIRDQDGLVIVPHPFDSVRGNGISPDEKDVHLIDHVEILNSRCLNRKFNEKAAQYAEKHDLRTFAGSDAHFPWEIGNAGVEIQDSSLREALNKENISVFNQKFSFTNAGLNMGLTTVVKFWKKLNSG
ncbi:MAG: histidinol-phosphatase [Methanobacteriales archaeon HGW-Methanobacteriales-1]|jgi:hypothetical protein|nr:MAG: histidinol-phosphatase [Methanobacteriales archaeon HGW-Methanobacteriales-1]